MPSRQRSARRSRSGRCRSLAIAIVCAPPVGPSRCASSAVRSAPTPTSIRRSRHIVGEQLGLTPVPATQVIARDRHAEYLWACAAVGSTMEMIAVELRHLQRTEVGEVQEGFKPGQKGSSAMPHKRNPISAETISGLSRVLRGNLQAGMQDIALVARTRYLPQLGRANHPSRQLVDGLLRDASNADDCSQGCKYFPIACSPISTPALGWCSASPCCSLSCRAGWGATMRMASCRTMRLRAWREKRPFRELLDADERVDVRARVAGRGVRSAALVTTQRSGVRCPRRTVISTR